ncbi:hypothetical protein Acr_11g0008280 [Actinidia rufa]|uniref:Uncharacterized protein n=1 Tax=Actinidia rufa TaxID=165716 RepID=A0A7J0FCW6_9ERIC|nr:hypothetical protein Acr_11g0008280 [Actinidia rufa]
MRTNAGEAMVGAKVGPEVTMASSTGGAVIIKREPRFKPKGPRSLVPPRRKLVKKMMFNSMAQAIASCFYTNNMKKKIFSD